MNKNWRFVFLLMVLVLFLVNGCGAESVEEIPAASEETAVPVEEPAEEEEPVEEPMEVVVTEEGYPGGDELLASQSVAILVVDDFGRSQEPHLPEVSGDFCPVSGEGQIFKSEGLIFKSEGLSWVTIPGATHGGLVFDQLSELISADFGSPAFGIDGPSLFNDLTAMGLTSGLIDTIGLDWIGDIQGWDIDGYNIILVPVDTNNYDSGVIADRVQAAMDAVNGFWNVETFVWNMSFGFIPCVAAGLEIEEEQYQALIESDEYLAALHESLQAAVEAGTISETQKDDLLKDNIRVRHVYTTTYQSYFEPIEVPDITNDPLQTFAISPLLSVSIEARVVPVGAAGNSGFDFPFAPAAWDGFVSVSSLGEDLVKAEYANTGEVMLEDSFVVDPSTTVIGTSFAAPRLSFLAARYLFFGGTLDCNGGGAKGSAVPIFNDDMMLDLPLDKAIVDYCPDF